MNRCDQCGNDYSQTFSVELDGRKYSFDCFECAIEMLAPKCQECGTRVIGHGVESKGMIFCCAHCARQEGVTTLRDHYSTDDFAL